MRGTFDEPSFRGAVEDREPGIHSHATAYGFQAHRFAASRNDGR
jgi:hypothetical protein